jgi:hypothetical protein
MLLSGHTSDTAPPIGSHRLAEFPELVIVGIDQDASPTFKFRNVVQTEQLAPKNLGEF